eukprot:UN03644
MNTIQLYKATMARTGAKFGDLLKSLSTLVVNIEKKSAHFCNDYGLLHDDVLYNDYDPVAWEALQRVDPAYRGDANAKVAAGNRFEPEE